MLSESLLPTGERLLLPSSPRARCHAAQQLIRPVEVAYLIADSVPSDSRLVIAVAEWLQRQLALGRLRYIPDPHWPYSWDDWCSPVLTLRRGGGDCDDFAILATSLLEAGGVFAVMVTGGVLVNGRWVGHAWVEGLANKRFFHLEATSGELHSTRPLTYLAETLLAPGLWTAA